MSEEENVNTNSFYDKNPMLYNTIIITVILFFVLTFIHYSISYPKIKGEVLVDKNRDAKEKFNVSDSRIEKSENNEFTYSCWFFIETFDYKKTQTKTIFYKGDAESKEYFPGVFLMPYTNNIKIVLSQEQDITKGVKRGKNSSISIKSVPIKKWNNLIITMSKSTMSVYLNGYLEDDMTLKGNIKPNNMPVIITDNGGFKGIIKKLVYYDKYFSSEKVYQIYSLGPDINNKVVTYGDYLFGALGLRELFKMLGKLINLDELFNINKICKAAGANVILDTETEEEPESKKYL